MNQRQSQYFRVMTLDRHMQNFAGFTISERTTLSKPWDSCITSQNKNYKSVDPIYDHPPQSNKLILNLKI